MVSLAFNKRLHAYIDKRCTTKICLRDTMKRKVKSAKKKVKQYIASWKQFFSIPQSSVDHLRDDRVYIFHSERSPWQSYLEQKKVRKFQQMEEKRNAIDMKRLEKTLKTGSIK